MGKRYLICVGTHHKTGTHWMKKVFRQIGRRMDIPHFQVARAAALARIPENGTAFLFNWASVFPQPLWDNPDARFLHIIRDPRDVLISGMSYHMTTSRSFEKFLFTPQDKWRGKTYQQILQDMTNDLDRYLFEMENMHLATLQQMLAWPYDHPNVTDIKYEDLISDHDCSLFRAFMANCGFAGERLDQAVDLFWRNSLFGGLNPEMRDKDSRDSHVQSGKPARWRREFSPELADIYFQRHADDLIALGYENDYSWIEEFRGSKDK